MENHIIQNKTNQIPLGHHDNEEAQNPYDNVTTC